MTTETPSSAAPGSLDLKVPFEVGIRRGVMLVAIALTFTWVTWAVADLSSMILPMFNLPRTYELEGWYTAQQAFNIVMLIPLFVGVVWLTRWPGPAREHANTVRVLVVVGGCVPPFLRLGYSFLDGVSGLGNIVTVFFELAGLVGALPIIAIVLFCSLILRDRANADLSKKLKSLALIYAGYRAVIAVLFTGVVLFGSGFGIFGLTRLVSFVFLGLFLWAFTKTWRSLV